MTLIIPLSIIIIIIVFNLKGLHERIDEHKLVKDSKGVRYINSFDFNSPTLFQVPIQQLDPNPGPNFDNRETGFRNWNDHISFFKVSN